MKIRVIIVWFLLVLGFSSIAQNANSLYRNVKKANKSLLNFDDSTLVVKSQLINRFTNSKTDNIYSFQFFNKSRGDYRFISAKKTNAQYLYESQKVTILYLDSDSSKVIGTKPFFFDKRHTQSWYNAFNLILSKKKHDFTIIRYTKPKIRYNNGDTAVLSQKNRKWGDERLIYFRTNNFRIFKYTETNINGDRPDSSVSVEIQYFDFNCFDSVNRLYNLGKYNDRVFVEKASIVSNQTYFDTLYLLGDSLLTNNSQQYFLLDYWYLGCPPCLKMMPFMEQLHTKLDTSKVLMLGINPYNEEQAILKYLNNKGYNFLQLNSEYFNPFPDVTEYPQLILVDENFREIKVFKGYNKSIESIIRDYLQSLDMLK